MLLDFSLGSTKVVIGSGAYSGLIHFH